MREEEIYNYHCIYNICKLNNPLNTMLYKKINEDNAQGCCGILKIDKHKNREKVKIEEDKIYDCRSIISNFKTNFVFFKYGNTSYNCTLSRHEFIIASDLLTNMSHFPNFMRPLSYIKNHIIDSSKKHPFELNKKKPSNKFKCVDLVLFEYIKHEFNFCKIVRYRCSKIKEIDDTNLHKIQNSLIMQIFLAIIASQQQINFVHNDLHSYNILIIKCQKNLKFLYRIKILGRECYFLIPTYGYIPVIIDYGFSYSKECENMSLECLDADNCGFISYKFDSISDFIRLFIVLYNSKVDRKIRNQIEEILRDLPLKFDTSWEDIISNPSIYYIECEFLEEFGKVYSDGTIGEQYLRLMLRNIILPIKYDEEFEPYNLTKNLKEFFNTWQNIDKWLSYDYQRILVFREFMDSLRKYKKFPTTIIENTNRVISNTLEKNVPINIDWDKLIKSATICVGCFQNKLYKKTNELDEKRKTLLYSKLISGENMFSKLLPFIYSNVDEYKLMSKDIIVLIDNIDNINKIREIEDDRYYKLEDIF